MKPIIFGIISSIIFNITLKPQISYSIYYFDVTAPGVPASGVALYDNDVTIRPEPFINPGDICSGSSYLCIVGFSVSELTAARMHLKPGARPIFTRVSNQN